MTVDDFRSLALELPEAVESSHQGHPDFRIRGKIFATIPHPDGDAGMVKLTPEQQKALVRGRRVVFTPVRGVWGQRGATLVHLETADEPTVRRALATAWRNAAPKDLAGAVDPDE